MGEVKGWDKFRFQLILRVGSVRNKDRDGRALSVSRVTFLISQHVDRAKENIIVGKATRE
jgi:hypothetical protein